MHSVRSVPAEKMQKWTCENEEKGNNAKQMGSVLTPKQHGRHCRKCQENEESAGRPEALLFVPAISVVVRVHHVPRCLYSRVKDHSCNMETRVGMYNLARY